MHAGSLIYSSRDWTIMNSRFSKVPWRRSPSTARLAEEAGVVVQSEPDRSLVNRASASELLWPCKPLRQVTICRILVCREAKNRNLRPATCGFRDTEGGPRTARKPGSVGVSSFLACEYETTSNDTA